MAYAAPNAVQAGFDGLEVRAASVYRKNALLRSLAPYNIKVLARKIESRTK